MAEPTTGASRPGEPPVSLRTVLAQWGRIGCTGFGGPPAHIALLRRLCVRDRGWLDEREFEDALAACSLLPGPASTQLAIFCAWRVRGRPGAVVGGVAFILPGLLVVLALAALFLSGRPPVWVRAAGAGAGSAVAAVAVHAAVGLMPAGWRGAPERSSRLRWLLYLLAGGVAGAMVGAWVVVVLLAGGAVEVLAQRLPPGRPPRAWPLLVPVLTGGGALLPLAWVAFKVGALSSGGGFVIIPLMQADAVRRYHWMSGPQFLDAVVLGQVTPGPVVQTVAAVGYAAGGLGAGVLASVIAFTPSFVAILMGAHAFGRLRADARARAFLDGAGPAAIGAVLGAAVPLALALTRPWQYAVLVAAAVLLLVRRSGVVLTLVSAAAVGVGVVLAGGPLPS